MDDGQLVRMKCLPWEVDGPQLIWTKGVPLLANERMSPEPGLKTNLIPLPGDQANLNQGRAAERLDDTVVAAAFAAARLRACVAFWINWSLSQTR